MPPVKRDNSRALKKVISRSVSDEKSKDPSLHSGHGFLPSVEMIKMTVIQNSQFVKELSADFNRQGISPATRATKKTPAEKTAGAPFDLKAF